MKACMFLWLLAVPFIVQADNFDWHMFVPTEGVNLNGAYGDHNQGVIQGSFFNFTELNFDDYTPFDIPDSTAVSAFALEPIAQSFVVWVSFSTPIDVFSPGEILRCDVDECQSVFSVQQDLNVTAAVAIDALDLQEDLISVSFDVGFTHGSEYIDPKNVYSIGSDGNGNILLVEQSNGVSLGMSEAGNMSAYDKSPNINGFSFFFGADTVFNRTNDTVFSNEILRIDSSNPTHSYAFGISEVVHFIKAFHSLNSGYVGLIDESIDVDENAGNIQIELYRTYGNEAYVSVLVESMDSSAVESVDYQFSPTAVEWFGGDDSNKSISLDIIDNQQLDGKKVFFLYVFAASEFASISGLHELIEIRIIDDEMDDLIFADGFD